MKKNRDIQIYLLLTTKLPLKDIVLKILKDVKSIEEKETFEYHLERWETIAGSFFRSIERSSFTGEPNPYSYVLDSKKYIYEKDRNMSYFNETGVSYQCRDLLLDTIRNEALGWTGTSLELPDIYIDNLTGESKEWREYNDKMYGVLSQLITQCM